MFRFCLCFVFGLVPVNLLFAVLSPLPFSTTQLRNSHCMRIVSRLSPAPLPVRLCVCMCVWERVCVSLCVCVNGMGALLFKIILRVSKHRRRCRRRARLSIPHIPEPTSMTCLRRQHVCSGTIIDLSLGLGLRLSARSFWSS